MVFFNSNPHDVDVSLTSQILEYLLRFSKLVESEAPPGRRTAGDGVWETPRRSGVPIHDTC